MEMPAFATYKKLDKKDELFIVPFFKQLLLKRLVIQ